MKIQTPSEDRRLFAAFIFSAFCFAAAGYGWGQHFGRQSGYDDGYRAGLSAAPVNETQCVAWWFGEDDKSKLRARMCGPQKKRKK
jgi:hypothetical protein